MNEQRRQILEMLADGRITAEEAERLIDALERDQPPAARSRSRPRYLRVVVSYEDGGTGDGPGRVNIRVPLQLLRAGVRLTSLIPAEALTRVNEQLSNSGVPIDLTQLRPQQLEKLIEHLDEVAVDIDDPSAKVQVFCE